MASSSLRLLLLQLIGHALGRHMSMPTLTTRLQQDRFGSSTKPTTTPLALLPRDEPPPLLTNSVTCGYTSGLWYSAVTCSPDQTCTYYTEKSYSAPNFGCCDSVGQSCGYVSTCIDYNTRNTFVGAYNLYLTGNDFYWCVCSQPLLSIQLNGGIIMTLATNTDFPITVDPKFRTVKQLCSTVRNTPPGELILSCRTLVGLKRAPRSRLFNILRKIQRPRGIALFLRARRLRRSHLLIRSPKQAPESAHQQPNQQQQHQQLPLPEAYQKAPKSASESALEYSLPSL
jgi:hypothetical protein